MIKVAEKGRWATYLTSLCECFNRTGSWKGGKKTYITGIHKQTSAFGSASVHCGFKKNVQLHDNLNLPKARRTQENYGTRLVFFTQAANFTRLYPNWLLLLFFFSCCKRAIKERKLWKAMFFLCPYKGRFSVHWPTSQCHFRFKFLKWFYFFIFPGE